MANRPAWTVVDNKIIKKDFTFEWNNGFAISQKRKNISNLHNAICNSDNKIKVLEVSTKSLDELGYQCSAFNLKLNGYYLENIFQSSKVYENGGPYRDLLNVIPKEAKRDKRHLNSGKLIYFYYGNEKWDINPKTSFYDYLYILGILQSISKEDLNSIIKYDWYTDIEFNPKKSINCQARSIAILKYLIINNMLGVLNNKKLWLELHKKILCE